MQSTISVCRRLVLNHSIVFVVIVCFGCTVCTVVSYERILRAFCGCGLGSAVGTYRLVCDGLTAYTRLTPYLLERVNCVSAIMMRECLIFTERNFKGTFMRPIAAALNLRFMSGLSHPGGAKMQLNVSFSCFLSHPGAITRTTTLCKLTHTEENLRQMLFPENGGETLNTLS